MTLQEIEYFIAVVEAGSIRAAARRIGMSQPALTRSLQQLEEKLGLQLMMRAVHGTTLTPAGVAFLTHARAGHAELNKAVEEARRSTQNAGGIVTVGVSPVSASLLLPELVIRLRQMRPETCIYIQQTTPTGVLSMVRDESVDVAVASRTSATQDAGLQYRPLFFIQLRVAARPGHPLAGMRDVRELASCDWLAQSSPGEKADIVMQSILAAGLPPPPPIVHWSPFVPGVFDLIANSDMLTTMPAPLLRSLVAAGKLIEIPLTKPLLPLHLGLYTRAGSPQTAATKAAIQIMVAIARRSAASGELRNSEPLAARGPQRP
jgi:LysR family transcriptional regulator, regulator of abg operon